MQITNNANGSGVKVNLIKGVSSEAIAEALIRINEQELNIIGYESQTKTYRDETSVLRDNTQVSANNANISATNANNSALLSTTKANEASNSANNAKASELLSAQYKADNENIKTNVQTLSNNASDSANTASIKANEASNSAIVSTTQANISTTKASEASTYATNSNTSAINALASENKAEEWASKGYGLEVENGLYSAKHYATEANNTLISMNSSVNPVANTVVKRDNNSDILTRTLNTTIESTSDAATKYYVETNNDGYLRPKVLSDVKTEIAGDKVTKTGDETISGVKTFTSNIVGNITGNAETVTNGVYTVDNQIIDGIKTFSSSPIVPAPTTGTQAVNKDYVDSKPTLSIGTILNAYTIFDNCIVAFGGEFNRADYPKLWAYLQANPSLVKTQAQWQTEATANGGICGFFSDGNGTTTFRVPNLDKAFLRPDSRGVGSFQLDEFKSHSHIINKFAQFVGATPGQTYNIRESEINSSTNPSGGAETRPKNVAVLPLIIAK